MRTAIKFFGYSNGNEKTVTEVEGILPTGGISGLSLSPDGKWLILYLAVLNETFSESLSKF
jgi:hypothetical protein